jgi:hypothetical protein
MVIVVYSSGLALSGMGNNPLVSDKPDRKGLNPGRQRWVQSSEHGSGLAVPDSHHRSSMGIELLPQLAYMFGMATVTNAYGID